MEKRELPVEHLVAATVSVAWPGEPVVEDQEVVPLLPPPPEQERLPVLQQVYKERLDYPVKRPPELDLRQAFPPV